MHVAIVLIKFGRVRLRGKSRQTLLIYIDSQRLIRCDYNVNAKVKFMAVDQQWVCNVTGYYRDIVHIQLTDVLDNMYPSSLGRIRWLYDPEISLGL